MVLGYRAKNVPADIRCTVEQFYGHIRVLQCLGYNYFDTKVFDIISAGCSVIWRRCEVMNVNSNISRRLASPESLSVYFYGGLKGHRSRRERPTSDTETFFL